MQIHARSHLLSLACLSLIAAPACSGDSIGAGNENNAECGNDVLDPGEECDGAELGDETCVGLGYPGGVLGIP